MPRRAVVVLLRGINLGGHNRLPMAELRQVLGRLGMTRVRTHLQSGNATGLTELADEELATAVTSAIEADLGLRVPCVVAGRSSMAALVDSVPLLDLADDLARLQAIVLSGDPDPTALADWRPDDPAIAKSTVVAIGPRVVYQWCPDGVHRAPNLLPGIERHWGLRATARNWRTVTTVLDWLDQLPPGQPGAT